LQGKPIETLYRFGQVREHFEGKRGGSQRRGAQKYHAQPLVCPPIGKAQCAATRYTGTDTGGKQPKPCSLPDERCHNQPSKHLAFSRFSGFGHGLICVGSKQRMV